MNTALLRHEFPKIIIRWGTPIAITAFLWLTRSNEVNLVQLTLALFLISVPWHSYQEWKKSHGAFRSYADEPVAATMAWKADDTLVLKLCAYETPYYQTLTLRFAGDDVFLDATSNVSFRPAKPVQLVGRLQ